MYAVQYGVLIIHLNTKVVGEHFFYKIIRFDRFNIVRALLETVSYDIVINHLLLSRRMQKHMFDLWHISRPLYFHIISVYLF